jgi:hypothetical protein
MNGLNLWWIHDMVILLGDEIGLLEEVDQWGVSLGAIACPDSFLHLLYLLPVHHDVNYSALLYHTLLAWWINISETAKINLSFFKLFLSGILVTSMKKSLIRLYIWYLRHIVCERQRAWEAPTLPVKALLATASMASLLGGFAYCLHLSSANAPHSGPLCLPGIYPTALVSLW